MGCGRELEAGRFELLIFLSPRLVRLCYLGPHMSDGAIDVLKQQVWEGRRVDLDEARLLYDLPLTELGMLAERRRQLAKAADYEGRGNQIVTYSRRPQHQLHQCLLCGLSSFALFTARKIKVTLTFSAGRRLDRKIEETLALGGTQILLQGGHHPRLPLSWYLDFLSHIKEKFPPSTSTGSAPVNSCISSGL